MGTNKVGALIVGLVLLVAPACGSDDGGRPASTTSSVPTEAPPAGPTEGPTDSGEAPPPPPDLGPPPGAEGPEAPVPTIGPGG